MGTVVTLPQRQKPHTSAAPTTEATILLFMGVRYVRDIEPDREFGLAAVEPEPTEDVDLPLAIA